MIPLACPSMRQFRRRIFGVFEPGKYPAAIRSLGLIAVVRLSFEWRALPGFGTCMMGLFRLKLNLAIKDPISGS